MEKLERILISVALDSTQQEALIILKKLKVCFCVECCEVRISLCFVNFHAYLDSAVGLLRV